ncbi:uncharacterized protein LOC111126235 [Crassostrea virginica]|uniref:Uncharacterized protein LOC111126235 n=1 Tax=Crassostrea virginica TaxID=6565 RepID=A0A8B8DHI6_CRAVI|nr:uncharacterized protein LOC111126235 [Crassostrea virginica]
MAEGGIPHEREERLPTLQDFLNNVELRSLYQDAEVQTIFKEIEDNPCAVLRYHNHPKVQMVLKLIQAEFDRHPPTATNSKTSQNFASAHGQSDDDVDIEEILKVLQQQEEEKSRGGSS